MANYKVVDADKLDADLTTVADAIRAKAGTEEQMSFPDGFVDAVEVIPKTYRTPYTGRLYQAIEDITCKWGNAASLGGNLYIEAEHLEEATIRGWYSLQGGLNGKPFSNCPNLKKVNLPNVGDTKTYAVVNCPSLVDFSIGSIGYPVSSIYERTLWGTTNNPDLVITVYVDAATLADVPTTVSGKLPGSAVDATIIYRNSTTGEVITE